MTEESGFSCGSKSIAGLTDAFTHLINFAAGALY